MFTQGHKMGISDGGNDLERSSGNKWCDDEQIMSVTRFHTELLQLLLIGFSSNPTNIGPIHIAPSANRILCN